MAAIYGYLIYILFVQFFHTISTQPVQITNMGATTSLNTLMSNNMVLQTQKNIVDMSENLKNIQGSTTSISSSLISCQVVRTDLIIVLKQLEKQKLLTKKVKDPCEASISLVEKIGISLQEILEKNGGTEANLLEIEEYLRLLQEELALFSDAIGWDLERALDNLEEFVLDPSSFSLPLDAFENSKTLRRTFELLDNLAKSDLTKIDVLKLVEYRGGFEGEVRLPNDLFVGELERESGSKQRIDFGEFELGGKVIDHSKLSTELNLPGFGKIEDTKGELKLIGGVVGDGSVDPKKIRGKIGTNVDVGNQIEGPLGSVSSGFGMHNGLDGFAKDFKKGKLSLDNSLGGGLEFETDPFEGGIGFGGSSDLDLKFKDLKTQLDIDESFSTGGRLNLGNGFIDGSGGSKTKGRLNTEFDLSKLTAETGLKGSSGIGGNIKIGDGSIGGSAKNKLNLSSDLDLKDKTAGWDFLGETGTSGSIVLPGNLGGLEYDIFDKLETSGHIDLKDLSQRSFELLKESRIITTLDLPGDKLESLTLELYPSLDLSKLGNLQFVTFANLFASDLESITEFNMLSENNLVKALKSGSEWLARLEIIDVLRYEIGVVEGLPEVLNRVRIILADMIRILEGLRLVKLFSGHVRSLGIALESFNLADLKVDLSFEVPDILDENGFQDMIPSVFPGNDGNPVSVVADALADFNIGTFLDGDSVEKFRSAIDLSELDDLFEENKFKDAIPTLTTGIGGLLALKQMNDAIKGLTEGGFIDMNAIVEKANETNLDLNNLNNLETIMNAANFDSVLTTPLTNLVVLSQSNGVDMNNLLSMAGNSNLDVNQIGDLSKIIGADLASVDLLNTNVAEGLMLNNMAGMNEAAATVLNSDLASSVANTVNNRLRTVLSNGRRLRARKHK